MDLSNKMFNGIRSLVELILPALATFYFAMSEIWGLPAGPQVVATITAVTVLLGAFLKVQRRQYDKSDPSEVFDGDFIVNTTDPSKDVYTLGLGVAFGDLHNKERIVLKVINEDA